MTIETPRLRLRPWHTDDAEVLYRYASEPRVSELALWPPHTSVDMSREVIERFFIPNPPTLAITLRSTGEPVGCIGLVPEGQEHYAVDHLEREVGYWIGLPYWGQGLTTEALEALAAYCRDTLGLKSLIITTDSRNIASQRVAEKCGFSLTGLYDANGTPSLAFRRIFQHPHHTGNQRQHG